MILIGLLCWSFVQISDGNTSGELGRVGGLNRGPEWKADWRAGDVRTPTDSKATLCPPYRLWLSASFPDLRRRTLPLLLLTLSPTLAPWSLILFTFDLHLWLSSLALSCCMPRPFWLYRVVLMWHSRHQSVPQGPCCYGPNQTKT